MFSISQFALNQLPLSSLIYKYQLSLEVTGTAGAEFAAFDTNNVLPVI